MTDARVHRQNGGWLVGGASVIGPSHQRRDLPNQDAFLFTPQDGSGSVIRAAVADGHGAAAHHRSDRGAQLAVEKSISVLDWFLEDQETIDLKDLSDQMIEAWRLAVMEDVERRPLEPAPDNPFTPYGCTLLTAAATRDSVCLTQLGDGDILLGYADDSIVRPIAPDAGLKGEQTYSICLTDAGEHVKTWFAHRNWDDAIPDFILMATDGVSKSFRTEDAFLSVAADYRERCRDSHDTYLKTLKALPEWLSELAVRGAGDDTTLILAVRTSDQEGSRQND